MILHAAHTAHNSHKILIRTVDADVILAVVLACTLEEEEEDEA